MTKTALDIAIVGAGMGGLTAAITLGRLGHRVTVYERTAALRPVGSALSVWPNGVKVLRAVGLGERIDAVSGRMYSMGYRDKFGNALTSFSLTPLYEASGDAARPISRTALQEILLDAVRATDQTDQTAQTVGGSDGEHQTVGASAVQLATACVDFVQDAAGVDVMMADGRCVRADLLIVADGSRSALRSKVVGAAIARSYRGYVNWNGRVAVSPDLADAHEWLQFVGDGKRVSLMPMGGDQFYFFFDVPLPLNTPNDPSTYREELSAYFEGWAAPVQALIQRFDPSIVARVEIHDTAPLSTLVNGRVALLGDAAHAMTPDLGQGGCQAMEDAWVLAQCLAGRSDAPQQALLDYQALRCERAGSIVARARTRAELIHGSTFAADRAMDRLDEVAEPAFATERAITAEKDRAVGMRTSKRTSKGTWPATSEAISEATAAWYQELASENGAAIIAGLLKTVQGGPLK